MSLLGQVAGVGLHDLVRQLGLQRVDVLSWQRRLALGGARRQAAPRAGRRPGPAAGAAACGRPRGRPSADLPRSDDGLPRLLRSAAAARPRAAPRGGPGAVGWRDARAGGAPVPDRAAGSRSPGCPAGWAGLSSGCASTAASLDLLRGRVVQPVAMPSSHITLRADCISGNAAGAWSTGRRRLPARRLPAGSHAIQPTPRRVGATAESRQELGDLAGVPVAAAVTGDHHRQHQRRPPVRLRDRRAPAARGARSCAAPSRCRRGRP